jgi:hypothetical protein
MIKNSDKQLGLYSGGLIFGIRWALVHVVGLYTGGGGGLLLRGLIVGGLR